MKVNIKHRQHYVFQAYLKSWSTNNQIWCCRNKQKCFLSSTVNVAQERDFYKIKDLNLDEETFILMFLHNQPKNIIETMQRQIETYKKPLSWQQETNNFIETLKTTIYKHSPVPQEVDEVFSEIERIAESSVNDMIEELHCDDEHELTKMLALLKQKDSSFYYQPYHNPGMIFADSKLAFLSYLCSQHYRTKAARNRLIEGLNIMLGGDLCDKLGINKHNIRPEHITHHIFWYIEGMLAESLYNKDAHLTLLLNHTSTPFLTTDQPVINILADYQDIFSEVSDLIFYYPISPDLAITVNDKNQDNIIELTCSDVGKYNKMLISASYEMIFADSEETIHKYLPFDEEKH